ncbi:DUF2213 domain-containing protein [Yokenella regensburgei]|uniref:DUF2213 domain-containing protein n=1 Tax=Yokenella regensburgei TaxID=158877 RepID=UPI003ED9FC33
MKYFYETQLGPKRFIQPDGSLLCRDVPIARLGTQTYLPGEVDCEGGPDGLVVVYRTEDEVFSPETMASFEGVAVTLGHPEDFMGGIIFINPQNFAELAHGHIQNVRRGEGEQSDLLLADMLIKRQEAIDAVLKLNLTDVSLGYDAKYQQISPGKARQYRIRGNHAAIVKKGRAGSVCSIGDSVPSIIQGNTMKPNQNPDTNWLKRLVTAIRTRDEDTLEKLGDEAPELPSDGMGSIAGNTINIHVPSQATSLPTENRTTTDENPGADPDPKAQKTGDDDVPAWAQAILARLDKLESGKTADEGNTPDMLTNDEDTEEDALVTGDAAYRQALISDMEILLPGFKPVGNKSLKRQALNHCIRTGDSAFIKSFGIPDYTKAPKATVDSVFKAAVALNKAKNSLPPTVSTRTFDSAPNTKMMSPAELNQLYAAEWSKHKKGN